MMFGLSEIVIANPSIDKVAVNQFINDSLRAMKGPWPVNAIH
jgi:hypothetical protein